MSFKIKKFNIESKWKEAIISKLNYVDSDSIVVPGGKTPLFLYKEYFSKKLSNILIPSDDRLTEDITKSNYNFIKSYSKTRVIKLCEFPVSDYKDVNLNKISDSILSCQPPNIGLLGLGDDGHFASIFPNSKTIKEDSNGVVRIIYSESSDQKYRVTLTEKFIKSIQELLFIVKGQSKFKIINKIKENLSSIKHLPIGKLIQSYDGKLNIMYCVND
mgnify:FL=1